MIELLNDWTDFDGFMCVLSCIQKWFRIKLEPLDGAATDFKEFVFIFFRIIQNSVFRADIITIDWVQSNVTVVLSLNCYYFIFTGLLLLLVNYRN